MTQTVALTAEMTGSLTGAKVGASAPRYDFNERETYGLQNGTADGQSDVSYVATRTLAASTSEDLDLAGNLETPVGDAVAFVEVTGLFITAAESNIDTITVGAASANAFVGPLGGATETLVLQPGQSFLVTNTGAGWPVVAGTGDLLKIANDGAGAAGSYTIRVIGRSA